jgi:hypothetical protein
MGICLDRGIKIIWGKEWSHSIEQLPDDINSESGCLLNVFFNMEFGKFATLYIEPENIEINSSNNKMYLEEIKNKWKENLPYIIYDDNKYKQICTEWNNSLNTVCSKDDFDKKIL